MKYTFIIILIIIMTAGCNKNPISDNTPKEMKLVYSGNGAIIICDLDIQEADTFALPEDSIWIPPNLLGEPYLREFAIQPRWSPDGEWIAFIESFAVDESHITIMRKDGTDMKVMLSTMANLGGIDWHPKGNTLVYSKSTAPVGGNYEIFIVDVATDSSTRLTYKSGSDFSPDFSPEGDQIVFNSQDSNEKMQIFIMDSDGTNIRQFTYGERDYHGPRWSPIGNKILFSQRDDGKDSEIYILNLNNMSVTKLTNNLVHDSGSSWSNDGQWIVFVKYSDGWLWVNPSIYMMKYDGTDEQCLIDTYGDTPDLFVQY